MPTTMATYAVSDGDDVTVDAVVGDGQPGGSTLMLGQAVIGSGGDEVLGVVVGKGSAIRGKKLIVASDVENQNAATNNTSTVVTVKGGAAEKAIQQAQVSTTKGEIISYVTVVTFT